MVEIRVLREEELESWYEHCAFVFRNGSIAVEHTRYFRNHYLNDPWRSCEDIYVAADGAEILSTVRVFRREIHMHGRTYLTGGIGEVSTKPAHQGRGYSGQLLRTAVANMERQGYELSLLAADKHDFYGKYGWTSVWSRSITGRIKRLDGDPGEIEASAGGLSERDNSDVTVRPVVFPDDIPQLQALYEREMYGLNGPVVRQSVEYWTGWVATEAGECLVAERADGQLAGYLVYACEPEKLQVREGCWDHEADVFVALLKGAYNSQPDVVPAVKMPEQLAAGIAHLLDDVQEERTNFWMIRLIDPALEDADIRERSRELADKLDREGFMVAEIDGF